MAEIRKVKVEEIKDVVSHTPDIPSNWYVPARQAWTYFVWCLFQIGDGKTFCDYKDMNYCLEQFEAWMENYAIAFGEEHFDEN